MDNTRTQHSSPLAFHILLPSRYVLPSAPWRVANLNYEFRN